MDRPFSQYELGVIVLRECPSAWEEQYYLLRQSLPTKLSPLCNVLEQIEKFQSSKKRESDAAGGGDNGGAKQKVKFTSDNTKRKSGDSKAYRISKKARNEKFCQHCKEYGGVHKTHNTSDSRRYTKGGLLQPSYSAKGEGNRCGNNGTDGLQNFVQLKAEMADLKADVERQSKKRKKGSSKKCYVRYESSSDSE